MFNMQLLYCNYCFQDFTEPYREKEAKYMARTNEAIFNRASEEHIRQPIPYDDVDSVKVLTKLSFCISKAVWPTILHFTYS